MIKKQKLILGIIAGTIFLSTVLANYVVAQDNNFYPPSPPPKAADLSIATVPLTNKPPVDPPKRENQIQVLPEDISAKPPTTPSTKGLEGATKNTITRSINVMPSDKIANIQIKKQSLNKLAPVRSININKSFGQKQGSIKQGSIKQGSINNTQPSAINDDENNKKDSIKKGSINKTQPGLIKNDKSNKE